MRIYTNIQLKSPSLLHAKKLLGEKRICWQKHPSSFVGDDLVSQWKAIWSSRDILVHEKISFFLVNVDYTMEGHVDRSDLMSGNFTYSEELVVHGYVKNKGNFHTKMILRTGVPSRFSDMRSSLTDADWDRVVGSVISLDSLFFS